MSLIRRRCTRTSATGEAPIHPPAGALQSRLRSTLAFGSGGRTREIGLSEGCRNPYRSIMVRAVETLYACDEALRVIENYEEPDRPFVPVTPRAGVGYAATEAPRGMLYHRYHIDDEGTITKAHTAAHLAKSGVSRRGSRRFRRGLS